VTSRWFYSVRFHLPADGQSDGPTKATEVAVRLRRLAQEAKLERVIRGRPDSAQAKEARQRLQALQQEREALQARLAAGQKEGEHRAGGELEARRQKIQEQFRAVARAYREADEPRREELRKQFDELAGGLVRVEQQLLRLQAEALEQQLKKVREELERRQEHGPEMIERLRQDLLQTQRPGDRPPGGDRVQYLLERLDADKDGRISKDEAKGPLADNFDRLDTNGDGYLDKEELRRAVPDARPPEPGASRPEGKRPDADR